MCNTRCLLVFLTLSVSVARSWDVAITTGDQLEFYSNQTKIAAIGEQFKDLTALAYDAVHNMLLFVDKQNDNASIFSYHLASKKYQALVSRRSVENIQGLDFDPVTRTLFWTDTIERSIFWISMKPGFNNSMYGNLLIKMDDEIPRAIAVDSCNGYIYWTNVNISKPTIERSTFEGTERKVIVDTDIFLPVSLVVDQLTKRLYWIDDKEGIHYSIESSNLEGGERETLAIGTHHQPNAMSVSKDYIYWTDWGFKNVWKLPKSARNNREPEEVLQFKNELPYGIVANYPIEDQSKGVKGCEVLTKLSQNKTDINDSFSIPRDIGLFCVHGVKVNGKLECKCTPGYTGERCDISVCQNYCFQGDCTFSSEGNPTCSCKEGFIGGRCETNVCTGYCLNNGICSLNKDFKPICSCSGDNEGERCEAVKVFTTTVAPEVLKEFRSDESCNCTNPVPTISSHITDDFVMTCDDSWDSVRDPIIMVLGILCGVLFLACGVLVTKILQLKKRPRIKKRIIVNKNVTPMTARPDQCEITIENCCNMNICETPCFEPRSTIRTSLLDTKPGKEEKKNLIANMEYPDDY